jgi:hypothetical protein
MKTRKIKGNDELKSQSLNLKAPVLNFSAEIRAEPDKQGI